MEEFSQAVLEERDSINEQLRLKEVEVEQERILRIELNNRLHELQNKVDNILQSPIMYLILRVLLLMHFISAFRQPHSSAQLNP